MEGGLIIDTTAMGAILDIGPDTVRVEAGCNILALNTALKAQGREWPRLRGMAPEAIEALHTP